MHKALDGVLVAYGCPKHVAILVQVDGNGQILKGVQQLKAASYVYFNV